MYIDLTPELKILREQLRSYFAKLMTPELQAELSAGGEGGGPEYRTAMKMGCGSESAGPSSTAGRTARRSSSSCSPTKCSARASLCRFSRSAPSARR
jgi:hypothetical protein